MSQAVAPIVQVGLVAAPGAPAELADWLAEQLGGELAAAHPQVRWEVRAVEDGLVQPPADDDEIVAATRRRLLAEDWDLALALTDVPLEVDRRPVVGSASPVHGVALLSLPALGAVGLRKRALQTALGLVRTLMGTSEDGDADDRAAMGRRLRELATDPADGSAGVAFTARVLTAATCGCCSAWCGPTGRGGWPCGCPARSLRRSRPASSPSSPATSGRWPTTPAGRG